MAKKKQKKNDNQSDAFVTPSGVLINHSLFKLDDGPDGKWTPAYRLEQAFDPDARGVEEFVERIEEFAVEQFGQDAVDDGLVKLPTLDGDKLAKKKEKRDKKGDAYKGMVVVRSSTIYNHAGDEGPGGTVVTDENNEDIIDKSEIYRGVIGRAVITLKAYPANWDFDDYDEDDDDTKPVVTVYLKAFQVTGEGERLGGGNAKDLFEADAKGTSKKKRKARDEDDDDEPRRKKKRKARDEDDDEDEPRKTKKKRKSYDDDDEDEKHRRKKKRARDDDDYDEDE